MPLRLGAGRWAHNSVAVSGCPKTAVDASIHQEGKTGIIYGPNRTSELGKHVINQWVE